MKKSKFIIALSLITILLAFCASGVGAANGDDGSWGVYVKNGTEKTIRGPYDFPNKDSCSVAVETGGKLKLGGERTDFFDKLRIDEGGSVTIIEDSYIVFEDEIYIAGELVIPAGVYIEFYGCKVTVAETGKITLLGELLFCDTETVNNGLIEIKDDAAMYVDSYSSFSCGKTGKFDIDKGGSLHGEEIISNFPGSVFADGAAGGYVITGVGAFVLGAAIMYITFRVRRKKDVLPEENAPKPET